MKNQPDYLNLSPESRARIMGETSPLERKKKPTDKAKKPNGKKADVKPKPLPLVF